MEIIVNAGQSRSLCFEALHAARTGNVNEVRLLLNGADGYTRRAHQTQTQLIEQDASEARQPVTLIMVHAQDRLMDPLLAREFSEELIHLYQRQLIQNNVSENIILRRHYTPKNKSAYFGYLFQSEWNDYYLKYINYRSEITMNTVKKLPLAMAIIAALCSISVMAQEFTQERINAIVAKAVDKALADRQAKIDVTANKEVNVIIGPQTTAASPDMAIPFGLKFSDYIRYGAHFQTSDQRYVGVDDFYNGVSAIGRLGNESNDDEFQISKAFKSAQRAIWDLSAMFDHRNNKVNLKKAYVSVINVLKSNPNVYIWAGRNFHQHPQQGISDYFWMNHDGQGIEVKNFDIGGVRFDTMTVSQVKSCSPEVVADETNPSRITCTGSSDAGDSGHYTLAIKTHNIKAGPINVEVYTNYGFDSRAMDSNARLEAWQDSLMLSHTNDNGVNKVILHYSDNSDSGVYNKTDDLTTVYASFEGSHRFTRQAQIEYLLAFHDYDNGKNNTDNRKNYGAIVRPMYFWNNVYSTWLEAGYQCVDYDQGGDNHGWRLTLSQNITIGMESGFRPMLRFYVTGGRVDNKHTAKVNGTQSQQLDSLNIGGVSEAWF